ncbi:MAG: cytochrome d ubiquinol oxidase subunit II, partial [Acidobacteria bacterium]|nr:cytochrome d ubiquinol oxidase subunit II [Acidobacteriota bacterium]
MDLNTLWFVLIGVLFTGFFFLEGFDYGVGILLPFLGKTDHERRMVINTIGPVWDGNEVWMITAGGAMFAAFPHWYATLFSGFYLALVLMLLALIVRGVAFEFRSKDDNPRWRRTWDFAIFFGSAIPALLWGVAMTNIIRGVPIDAEMNYVGGFFNLLNPYALIGGIASLLVFSLHGACFLTLKLGSGLEERARAIAVRLWWPAAIALVLFVLGAYVETDIYQRLGVNPGVVPLAAGTGLITFIAMLVAGPIGLFAAIYMAEYAHPKWRGVIKPVLEILAGIPTVVYGFFAALTVAPLFRDIGEGLGLDVSSESALAAGSVMSIMIIPFISSL